MTQAWAATASLAVACGNDSAANVKPPHVTIFDVGSR